MYVSQKATLVDARVANIGRYFHIVRLISKLHRSVLNNNHVGWFLIKFICILHTLHICEHCSHNVLASSSIPILSCHRAASQQSYSYTPALDGRVSFLTHWARGGGRGRGGTGRYQLKHPAGISPDTQSRTASADGVGLVGDLPPVTYERLQPSWSRHGSIPSLVCFFFLF